MDWTVIPYEAADGEPVVKTEMQQFGAREYVRLVKAAHLLEEYGLEVGASHVKHLSRDLWELRFDRYRILYTTFPGRRFILLRVFMKKTQKTPTKELRIAANRMKDFAARYGGSADA